MVGFLFRQVLCFIYFAISVSNHGLKCWLVNNFYSECSVALLFRHNFKILFLRKCTQNTRESILQWLKEAMSLGCVSFFFHNHFVSFSFKLMA